MSRGSTSRVHLTRLFSARSAASHSFRNACSAGREALSTSSCARSTLCTRVIVIGIGSFTVMPSWTTQSRALSKNSIAIASYAASARNRAGYKYGGKWGYVRLSGMLRDIRWVQRPVDTLDLSGHVTGWGTSLSSNIKFPGQDVLRLQLTYGEGIQNYFNDAPVDVGAKFNLSNRRTPLTGEALPIVGGSAYLDHYWNPRVTSAIGMSWVNIDNSDAQPVNAYHNGEYASVNLLWVPVTNVLMGAEFQYGRRVNVADDFSFNGYRLQVSFKYSFSKEFGGTP